MQHYLKYDLELQLAWYAIYDYLDMVSCGT